MWRRKLARGIGALLQGVGLLAILSGLLLEGWGKEVPPMHRSYTAPLTIAALLLLLVALLGATGAGTSRQTPRCYVATLLTTYPEEMFTPDATGEVDILRHDLPFQEILVDSLVVPIFPDFAVCTDLTGYQGTGRRG